MPDPHCGSSRRDPDRIKIHTLFHSRGRDGIDGRHPAMIEFERVNKYFGNNHILVDVTETIARGEALVICGPSGSGKSRSTG